MRLTILLLLLCSMLPSMAQVTEGAQERGVSAGVIKKDTVVVTGNTYAVIVGVSDYKYVRPLSYADQDARLFKEFLKSKSGGSVKEENIMMILNEEAKASTYPQIRRWILDKKAQAGDRVYFYLAGHGDAIDADEYFFLLSDCNPAGDKNNYVGGMASVLPMYSIKALIHNNLIKKDVQVIMIWDACRTNELPGGADGMKIAQQGIAEKSSGELIMLSASAGETALENRSYAHGHGLFTYYLIDGLSGAADLKANGGNNDGKVDMRELDTWVKQQVRRDANDNFKSEQNPQFIYPSNVSISIIDDKFAQQWAFQKQAGNETLLARNVTGATRSAISEVDSVVTSFYNRCMKAMKSDNIEGENGAESLVREMQKAYPEHSLTRDVKFNLAMEYINLAQERINLYLSGIDDQRVATTNDDGLVLNRLQRTVGRTYSANAAFLGNAIKILRESGEEDTAYLHQLEARQNFFLARGYYSREGKITDPAVALKYAQKALAAQPDAAYNLHMMGLLNFNNTDSAFFFEKKALAIAPHWVYALNSMGLIFGRLKQYDSAQWYARRAIASNAEYAPAYNNLGNVLSVLKKPDSAKLYFWHARYLNPKLTNTYNNLGALYQKLQQYDSAKWYYRMADIIDPKYSYSATSGMGNIFYTQMQYDSAKWYMRKAIKSDPKFPYAYSMMGSIFYMLKQYDSSFFYVQQSLAVDPKYPSAYNMSGVICNVLKKYDSARWYFKNALMLDPTYAVPYANLGLAYNRIKQYDSAKFYCRKSIMIDPNYSFAYNGLAFIFQQTQEKDSAVFYRRRSMQLNPRNPYTYSAFGDYYFELKQYDSARMYAFKALAVDPNYVDAMNTIGRSYYVARRYDSARVYYQKMIAVSPKSTVAFYNIGLTFFEPKNRDSALWYYRNAIRIDPTYRDAYSRMGLTFTELQQFDSALKYYRMAVTIDPRFSIGNNALGVIFKELRQYDSAKLYSRQTINIDQQYLAAYMNLGEIHNVYMRYDSANSYFRKVIALTPTYIPAYCNLAANFFLLKQYDSGTGVLQDVIATRKWNDSNYQSLYINSFDPQTPQDNAYVNAAMLLKGHKSLDAVKLFSRAFLALDQPAQVADQSQKILKATASKELMRTFLEKVGTDYLENNNYAGAEQCFRQVTEMTAAKGNYLLSCLYSKKNEVATALIYLEQAFLKGYKLFHNVNAEESLDAVRKTEKYQQLIQEYFPGIVK